jgi:hypothetical protein
MNMKFPIFTSLLLAMFALFHTACKKPSPFGSELLQDEYADYDFTDTITVQCTLLREDSIATSDKAAASSYFLCGAITDPVLGKYSSDIYSLLLPAVLNPQFGSLDSITMDSIVLYLNYAPAGVYGDTLQPQTLRVIRLAKVLNVESTYYSNASIEEGAELGRLDNFLPKPHVYDSLFQNNEGAFLRVKLDNEFGKELLGLDSLSWVTDSAFYQKLRGLKIVCSSNGATPGAMLAFNLNNNGLSRVALYYTYIGDTTQSRFDFYFRNTNKFTHFEHDYSGSEVASLIGKPARERLYLHGMEGLRMKVTFPYANQLDKIAVNKAQLVLTVADNDPVLTPVSQLALTESVGDSTYNFISDVLYALGSSGTGSLSAFGGFPEKELVNGNILINRYRLALSEKFQHIIDDDAAPNIKNRTVYINVYPRSLSARRSILYGPESNTFPAKLELKYTRVK